MPKQTNSIIEENKYNEVAIFINLNRLTQESAMSPNSGYKRRVIPCVIDTKPEVAFELK